jgi:DNA-binding SARP family transcriptional activator/WD40 repeat protein
MTGEERVDSFVEPERDRANVPPSAAATGLQPRCGFVEGVDMEVDGGRQSLSTLDGRMRLSVMVLGPLIIEHDRDVVHIAGTHRRRLLAVLASRAGDVVGVDAIVDALWAEEPPPTAAKTIQSHVARLRASLAPVGGDVIETTPGGYRLAADVAVDAVGFEHLVAQAHRAVAAGDWTSATRDLVDALRMWRGAPYSDFPDAEFAAHERTRLVELHGRAIEDLAEARLESGAAAAVTAELERVVAEHPGRERAWALLMRALYASGRQQEALVAYQRARRALADGYGLDPGPELRELERRVLEQDPGLTIARRIDVPSALRGGADGVVGRAAERAWLTDAWSSAREGCGQLRLLFGPPDSGRTRLAAQLAATAAGDQAAVVYARGGDDLHTAITGGPAGTTAAVVGALAERSRRQPVLVVVDDVQWAAAASMEALRVLSEAIEQLAVMILLIADPAGGGPAVQELTQLDPSGGRTTTLGPMPDEELARLVAADGVDDPGAVAAIVAVAAGRPGAARREATAWVERVAGDRLTRAAATSVDALAAADEARDSVVAEVARLVRARSRRQRLATDAWTGRQPYRGLSSYGPEDVDVFVGRERLVAELASRSLDRRLVIVTGASGSGKSSLVRAGLVPLVRSGLLPASRPWRVNVVVPGREPHRALDELVDLDEPGPQLLVIDQFEEAFASPPAVVDGLVRRVLDLALDPALDAHIVLMIRADQYGNLADVRHLAGLVDDTHLLVGRPNDEELRRIIEEPAARAGCRVEPELVAAMLHDVGDSEGTLPLLSTALAELWDQRDGDVLSAARYESLGGLAASVERLGARVLERAAASRDAAGAEDTVRRALLLLADVTDDGSWVRRRLSPDELPADLEAAVDALVEGRLAVRDGGTIEIAHEIVFRAWPRLHSWLEDARADLVLGHRLRAAAMAWADQGQTDDDVYRGARLAAAVEWCARHADSTTDPVRAFVHAGVRVADRDRLEAQAQLAREQRSSRRLRRSLVAASLLLVLALVAAGMALAARSRADDEAAAADAAAAEANTAADLAAAREAEAQTARDAAASARDEAEDERDRAQVARLIAESERAIERRLDVALLLAVEARRHDDSIQSRGALLTALTQGLPPREPTLELTAPVTSSLRRFIASGMGRIAGVDISDDGRTVVVNGDAPAGGGMFAAFDTDSGEELRRLEFDESVALANVDPTGSFALVRAGKELGLYGLRRDGDRAVAGVTTGRELQQASLSADGSMVSVGWSDGTVDFHDASTGQRMDLASPPQRVTAGRFRRDGAFLYGAVDEIGRLTIHVWDVAAGTDVHQFTVATPHPDWEPVPDAFILSPDGSRLIATDFSGGIDVWDTATGSLIGDRADRPGDVRGRPAFVTDTIIALGRPDGQVLLYDLDAERLVRAPLEASGGGIWALDATPDGRTLVSVGDDEGRIRIWGPDDQGTLDHVLARDRRVTAVSADRSTYALVAPDGAIELRAVDGSRPPVQIVAPAGLDGSLSLSADGRQLVDVAPVFDMTVPDLRVIDTSSGRVVWTNGGAAYVDRALFSADGTHLFVVSHQHTRLSTVDLATGKTRASTGAEALGIDGLYNAIRPTSDGRFLDVSWWSGVVRLDAGTLNVVRSVEGPPGIQGIISSSAGGDVVLAAGTSGRLYRFDMATGDVAIAQSRDNTSLYGAVVSPDETLIAAGHPFTSAIALFDAATLRPIGRPIPAGNLDGDAVMTFTPDGDLLAGGRFGVNRWEMDPDEWQRIACHAAGRNLTRAEWSEHLGDEPYRPTCAEWSPGD